MPCQGEGCKCQATEVSIAATPARHRTDTVIAIAGTQRVARNVIVKPRRRALVFTGALRHFLHHVVLYRPTPRMNRITRSVNGAPSSQSKNQRHELHFSFLRLKVCVSLTVVCEGHRLA